MTAPHLSDPAVDRALTGAGKWARNIAIVGFVFFGLALLIMLTTFGTVAALLATQPGFEAFAALGTAGVAVVVVLYFGFFFFLNYKLYRFGSTLHAGRGSGVTDSMVEEAFGHLATLMKVSVITFVVFIAIGLVVSLLIGGALVTAG